MIINNKLDKAFGPVGTISGVILFFVGLGITIAWLSFTGLILFLIGAFVGFTSTSALIDFDKKRVKFSNNLMGIIQYGQWVDIEPDMKLGVKKSILNWRTYSRGNRTFDIDNTDFRVILYDSDYKEMMPVMKTSTLDDAKDEAEKICNQLGLSMI